MRFFSIQYKNKEINRGFTLVELMVALSIFTLVMVISMGSILSIFDANQKSKNIRAVMDNLNYTLEGMTRTIRFGSNYHCGSSGNTALPLDCPNPPGFEDNITILAPNGTQVTYALSGGRITRSIDGGATSFLTSPDVNITTLNFRVYGSPAYAGGADVFQPQVIIVIGGNVGVKNSTKSSFNLETTVSQRLFDFQ